MIEKAFAAIVASATLFLTLFSGCASHEVPQPQVAVPKGLPLDRAINNTWSLVSVPASAEGLNYVYNIVLSQEMFDEGKWKPTDPEYGGRLDIVVMNASEAWAVQIFEKTSSGWRLFSSYSDVNATATVWEAGEPRNQEVPTTPGLRTFKLKWITYEDQVGLGIRYKPDDGLNEANPESEYKLVVSSIGQTPFGAAIRTQNGRGESECRPWFLATDFLRDGFQFLTDCKDPENMTAYPVNPIRIGSGFRHGLHWDYRLGDQGYVLHGGDMEQPTAPVEDGPNTTIRVGTYKFEKRFEEGWSREFLYYRNPSTVGEWKGRADAYGASWAGQGPIIGGPTYGYLAGCLIVSCPVWICEGGGRGIGESSLELNSVTVGPARMDAEMLAYARVDFGTTLDELLGGPALEGLCSGIPVAYVLELVKP